MNCNTPGIAIMKARQIKLLQDIRQIHYLPRKHVLPKPALLYLMRLRSDLGEIQAPGHRFTVPVVAKDSHDFHAQPVKITRL
jgi:hypothetical protein